MNIEFAEAIDFTAQLHIHNAEMAAGYRAEYTAMAVAFVTGLAAAFGFWSSLADRARFYPAFCLLAVGAGGFVVAFQLHWYQYHHLSDRWAAEYHHETVKLIRGQRSEPFALHACDDAPITWRTRKAREVIDHWNDTTTGDPCDPVRPRLLTWRQANIWTFLIIGAIGAAVAAATRSRRNAKRRKTTA